MTDKIEIYFLGLSLITSKHVQHQQKGYVDTFTNYQLRYDTIAEFNVNSKAEHTA